MWRILPMNIGVRALAFFRPICPAVSQRCWSPVHWCHSSHKERGSADKEANTLAKSLFPTFRLQRNLFLIYKYRKKLDPVGSTVRYEVMELCNGSYVPATRWLELRGRRAGSSLEVCTFYEHTILFELLRSSGFPVTTLKPIETTKTKIKVGDFLR